MMRFNPKMKVREVAGEHIVMRTGGSTADLTTVIAFNESSMLLYERLKDRPFTEEDAVALLREEYEVDEATARQDVDKLVQQLRQHEMLLDA